MKVSVFTVMDSEREGIVEEDCDSKFKLVGDGVRNSHVLGPPYKGLNFKVVFGWRDVYHISWNVLRECNIPMFGLSV